MGSTRPGIDRCGRSQASIPYIVCRGQETKPRRWRSSRAPRSLGRVRYAVGFVLHYWDPFVARQYGRLAPLVPPGDLWAITDETGGPVADVPETLSRVPVTPERVGRLIGDVPRERGFIGLDGMLWWNIDIATYALFDAHPTYEHCLTMDYDVCLNVDLGRLMQRVQNERLDLVCHSHADMETWSWARPHRDIYPGDELRGALAAVMILSRPAASFLVARRRLAALEYRQGKRSFWPFGEAFVPSELARAGFRCAELGDFVDLTHFRWRPIVPEAVLAAGIPRGATHPVRPHADGEALYPAQR